MNNQKAMLLSAAYQVTIEIVLDLDGASPSYDLGTGDSSVIDLYWALEIDEICKVQSSADGC